MVVSDPQFRVLFLLPMLSLAWAGGLHLISKILLNSKWLNNAYVCPFCSFHHLILLLRCVG